MTKKAAQLVILQVLPRLQMGGVERGTVDLVSALTENYHQAVVASAGGKLVEAIESAGGTHVELPLSTKNPLRIIFNTYLLYKLIKKYRISVVHCRSRAPAWSCWLATKWSKVAFVTTVHGAYKTQPALKKWYSKIMTKSDKIIAISRYIFSYIQTLAPECAHKTVLIPRGVDMVYFNPQVVTPERLDFLKKSWKIKENIRVILFPARLTRLKNHGFLFKALSTMVFEPFQCLVVGKGSERYLEAMKKAVQLYQLEQKVQFVGECLDMPAAYLLADVVVQVSEHPEAFGRVVAEAQAMGCPVIAPQMAGPEEIIVHEQTGWLYPPGNQHIFVNYLKQALHLKGRQKEQLAVSARQRISALFTKDQMVNQTIRLYQELLASR